MMYIYFEHYVSSIESIGTGRHHYCRTGHCAASTVTEDDVNPAFPYKSLYSAAPYLLLYVNTNSLKRMYLVAPRQAMGSEAKRRNGRRSIRSLVFF